MGIHNAFGSADFSEMINSPLPFKFDDAIQKAFFEINEDGAEAGAATGKDCSSLNKIAAN